MSDPLGCPQPLTRDRPFLSRRLHLRPELAWFAIWLWPLIFPISDIAAGRIALRGLAIVGLLAFVVLYLASIHDAFRVQPASLRSPEFQARIPKLVAFAAVTIALAAGYQRDWVLLLTYLVAVAAATLPLSLVPAGAIVTLGITALIASFPETDGSVLISAASSAAIIYVVRRLLLNNTALHAAREEVAKLAVADERLRFARDLHDLLGHTLSVIVVKAEVVRRLVDTDPNAAAAAAADIEAVGRRALDDVREAVGGYRQPSLSTELDSATAALADAKIDVDIRTSGLPLSAEASSALGWALRESVTNVVRHSQAARCDIVVRRASGHAVLEVIDDGVGSINSSVDAGNGLRGLRERLAQAGGTLDAGGSAVGNGFRLVATVPVTAPD